MRTQLNVNEHVRIKKKKRKISVTLFIENLLHKCAFCGKNCYVKNARCQLFLQNVFRKLMECKMLC